MIRTGPAASDILMLVRAASDILWLVLAASDILWLVFAASDILSLRATSDNRSLVAINDTL